MDRHAIATALARDDNKTRYVKKWILVKVILLAQNYGSPRSFHSLAMTRKVAVACEKLAVLESTFCVCCVFMDY